MSGDQRKSQKETAPSQPTRRRPERPSLSCTECRRRKQKCNQGKPCTNCSRRFPQPICEYDTKLSKRSKRTGSQSSEDPTLAVTDNNGPYSHLKNTGVQDAILQIELPTRVIRRGATEANSSSSKSWSSGSDVREHDGRDPWRLFTPQISDQQTIIQSKAINQAIRKIVQERAEATGSADTGDWQQGAAVVIRAVHDSLPPLKPIGSYFDDVKNLPMVPTRLNKELVRTHLQILCRYKVSIDGNPGRDNAFMRHWIPFTIQDPLMLQVVLYTSACFLRETGHVPKTLTMAYKGNTYQLLNQSLRSEKTQCNDVTVLAVSQLVIDEWYWGATNDLRAHMLGLKMVIRMRGGLQKLGMHGFLAKLVLMHDIGIALAHETEPMMFDWPGFEFDDPIMVPFQTSLNSPFVSGWPTFASSSLSGRMNPGIAAILDDMRILIETVLSGLNDNLEHTDPTKLASTVSWIQQRLDLLPQEIPELPDRPSRENSEDRTYSSSPAVSSVDSSHSSPPEVIMSGPDPIYSWVRRTAIIYCRAIANRQPLSVSCIESDFDYLWQFTWRSHSDATWTTVGILFWVLTAITPAALNRPASRSIKTVMICCLMNMGVENWHVTTDAARRALRLQAWLRRGGGNGGKVFGGEKGIDRYGFSPRDKLTNFGLTAHYEDGDKEE